MTEVEHNRRATDKSAARQQRLSEAAEGIIDRVIQAEPEENLIFRAGFAHDRATKQYGFTWGVIFSVLTKQGYLEGFNDCYFRTNKPVQNIDPKIVFMGIVTALLEEGLGKVHDETAEGSNPEVVDYDSLMKEQG